MAAALCLVFQSRAGAGQSVPKRDSPFDSSCIGTPSTDANLRAIVEEIFREKPKRLLEDGLITREFYGAINASQLEICDDRTWDVVTLPRMPPLVSFDASFLTLLFMEARSMTLGQYLANEHAKTDPLGLHTVLMRTVLAQNVDRKLPPISFETLVNDFMPEPIDISKYLTNAAFQRQERTLFLVSLYFLTFHEFCHIRLNHLQRQATIAAMPEASLPPSTTKAALRVQLEKEADSCAVDIVNRDEARYNSSPIVFFAVFVVSSTQAVLDTFLPNPKASANHPSPAERMADAYDAGIHLVQGLPNAKRYSDTLTVVFEHFKTVTGLRP
jgi:hypothetical protein